ncbi:MAG: hypothetical protein LCH90_00010 [Proteobacteria bacterium]|nr:hypothetical protein [Pseudomonadota bacterium]
MRVTIRNRGDRAVPYPKLELFLTDASLGFDTRFATHVATTQYDGILLPDMQASVEHRYEVPAGESGHKCLFARTWSYSPPDLPLDLHALDPCMDRRVAQQNLHILGQSQPYPLQLVHQPNARELIRISPLTREELLRLAHPFTGEFRLRDDIRADRLLRNVELADPIADEWMERGDGVLRFSSRGEGASLEERADLHRRLAAALRAGVDWHDRSAVVEAGSYRGLVMAWRKLHQNTTRTRMRFEPPALGLRRGEAAGFSIVALDDVTRVTKGGVTLIVIGE